MARHRTPQERQELGERVRELRRAGIGRSRIGRELGIGADLAKEFLRDEPLPDRLMRPRAKDDHRAAAVALRADGRTYDEISVELGVSKGSLSLWLRDLDHPTITQRAAVHDPPPVQSLLAGGTGRKARARRLRLDGWLLREIAQRCEVTLSTAGGWCAGLPVPSRAKHGGSSEHCRQMRRDYYNRVLAERQVERERCQDGAASAVGHLTDRELELIAVTAYWCEGSKSKPWSRREFLTFINSDPGLVLVFLTWLRGKGVPDDALRLSVSIHERADVAAAEAYWAEQIGIDVSRFAKPNLKRHNPKTMRHNSGVGYVGCLSVGVRGSKDLYRHVEGTWQGIMAANQKLSARRSRVVQRQDIGL